MEPRILRVFLRYASEDVKIALAIAACLREALGEVFAEICFDQWFLQAGSEFKKQIESKLEKTDVLIIVYIGVDKHSHSFTGWKSIVNNCNSGLKNPIYLKTTIEAILKPQKQITIGTTGAALQAMWWALGARG